MSSDLQMEIIRAFGGNPIIVNYGELFTACQQGTVDGMMTSTGLYVSDRFYEVQKYMGAANTIGLLHIPLVNFSFYNGLSPELKKAFDETIPLYLKAVRKYEDDYEAAAIEELKKRGMQVNEYTPGEKQAFVTATAYIMKDKADIAGKEIIDQIRKELGK
jgi:TRAP-type C4-dicarboxylate transport system substrate-binding protein